MHSCAESVFFIVRTTPPVSACALLTTRVRLLGRVEPRPQELCSVPTLPRRGTTVRRLCGAYDHPQFCLQDIVEVRWVNQRNKIVRPPKAAEPQQRLSIECTTGVAEAC